MKKAGQTFALFLFMIFFSASLIYSQSSMDDMEIEIDSGDYGGGDSEMEYEVEYDYEYDYDYDYGMETEVEEDQTNTVSEQTAYNEDVENRFNVDMERDTELEMEGEPLSIQLNNSQILHIDTLFEIDFVAADSNMIVDTNSFLDLNPEIGRFSFTTAQINSELEIWEFLSFYSKLNIAQLEAKEAFLQLRSGEAFKFSVGKIRSGFAPLYEEDTHYGIEIFADVKPVNYILQVGNGITLQPGLAWNPLDETHIEVNVNYVVTNSLFDYSAYIRSTNPFDIPIDFGVEYADLSGEIYTFLGIGFAGKDYQSSSYAPFVRYYRDKSEESFFEVGLRFNTINNFYLIPEYHYGFKEEDWFFRIRAQYSL